ncbi:LysR substrate-binding domain-containing protein [Streptomyces sp. NPDC096323]|uniref:LysR substrate-binding domain-containing protein n=1 Tax=Streptomyces sp. NPDC096323 TaxID=3155822 RepID=UPI003322D19B
MQIVDGLRRLRAGDVDLLVVSLPHHEPDMVTGPVLFSEPRVLGVSSGHPLARRDSVSLEDLEPEHPPWGVCRAGRTAGRARP